MNRATPPAAAERPIVRARRPLGLRRLGNVVRFVVALFTIITIFTAVGNAADRKAKSKSKPTRAAPGPEWADTNYDGQLSKEEFERAKQMLEEKIKKAKADTKTKQ